MAIGAFGPGIIIVTRLDIPNQAPVNVGYAQELTIDATYTTKQLHGTNQFALLSARGTAKTSGKFKAAEISALAWNAVFYGLSLTAGGFAWNVGEAHTVPSGGGTITVSNSAGFDIDLGVVYASNNVPFGRVTTAPSQGNYSLGAGGAYDFASADQSLGIAITYTSTTTIGQSLIITNQPIGYTPTFQLDYWTELNQPTPTPFAIRLYRCIGGKHAMGFKLEDFMMPEFDFEYYARADNVVGQYVFPTAS
jgi:hypothetical protein